MKSILSDLDMEIMVSFSVYFSLHAFIHTHIHLFIYLPILSYVHQVFVSVDSIPGIDLGTRFERSNSHWHFWCMGSHSG